MSDYVAMTECISGSFRSADEKLNSTYQAAQTRLKGNAEAAKLLVAAQRRWVSFRDAECELQGLLTVGGSVHSTIVAGCLEELTKKRIVELNYYVVCQEGDLSCP